jgi:exopolysaccharide biosynthesis polyprenyl glycosylphosphotransferase
LDDRPSQKLPGVMVLGGINQARQVALDHQVDEVIMTLPYSGGELEDLVKALLDIPLHVRVVPASFTLALDHAVIDDFGGIPMIDLRAGPLREEQRMVKRAFDLIVASTVTLITLPIMGAVAIAIRLDSPGPILFKQQRVGENGRYFTMYKFRSMVQNAEALQQQVNEQDAEGHTVHKRRDDPRITKVGHFIRRTSLDELPQLFNVLKGEMSLVGPRPELPWLVEKYDPWQRRRLVVPPGITGWWQVTGRSDRLMHLHTDDDIYYIANYSFWLDIRIMWKTLWTVLAGTGAH